MTIYRITAASFNDFVKANLTWQGPVEQHPLVNYLQHEGGLIEPDAGALFTFAVCTWRWDGKEPITIPVDGIEMGSISMLSVQVG